MVVTLRKAICLGILTAAVCVASPRAIVRAQEQESNRKTTKMVPPVYPSLAKKARLSGIVKLMVVVGPEGTVKSLRTIGGNAVLAVAAEEAVKRWKFEPLNKESVETVAVRFAPQ